MREFPKEVVCISDGWFSNSSKDDSDRVTPKKGRLYIVTGLDSPEYYWVQGFGDSYHKDGFVDIDPEDVEISEVQEVLEKRETYIS